MNSFILILSFVISFFFHENPNNERILKPPELSSVNSDSIIIHFQGWYKNDKIKIYSKSLLILNTRITTNESTGLAYVIAVKKEPDVCLVINETKIKLAADRTIYCLIEKRKKVLVLTYTNEQPHYK